MNLEINTSNLQNAIATYSTTRGACVSSTNMKNHIWKYSMYLAALILNNYVITKGLCDAHWCPNL